MDRLPEIEARLERVRQTTHVGSVSGEHIEWLLAEVKDLRRRVANAEKLAQDSAKVAEEMRIQRDVAQAELAQLTERERRSTLEWRSLVEKLESDTEELLQQLSHAASENALLKRDQTAEAPVRGC